MRLKQALGITAILMGSSMPAMANTWNEPWQSEVATTADTLGLYHVDSVAGTHVTLTLKKHLAGLPTAEHVDVDGYYLHRITSSSSNDWSPAITVGTDFYLFLKQKEPGHWQLPTPTAGSDEVRKDGKVTATYRISMHKALESQDVYELTQVCIFEVVHGRQCRADRVQPFVDAALAKPVGIIGSPEETERFFEQHAALETAAAAKLVISESTLSRYLASDSGHVQVSALRYLASSSIQNRYSIIAVFICDSTRQAIARVFGVMLLDKADARNESKTLTACAGTLSTDEVSIVRNIMDPRIGTAFPNSVKSGVDALLMKWDSN